jgi:hypothetical protein
MKKILSLLVFAAMAVFANAQNPVELIPSVEEGNLVLKFENNSGKVIANVGIYLQLPEGITLKPKGKKYAYEEGDATEGMTFSVVFNQNTKKYNINVYDGEFDETAGNTIVSLPLVYEGDLTGEAVFTDISFGDPDAANICRIKELKYNLDGTAINAISADQTKSGVIYNLAGQRVSKAVKGIYVVDGKKVAVK